MIIVAKTRSSRNMVWVSMAVSKTLFLALFLPIQSGMVRRREQRRMKGRLRGSIYGEDCVSRPLLVIMPSYFISQFFIFKILALRGLFKRHEIQTL